MFHTYLDARMYGEWEERTVWKYLAPHKWSILNGYINGEIPVAFYSDFASTPRHFRLYDKYGGKCNGPAGVHDLTYREDAEIFVDVSKFPAHVVFPDDVAEWLSLIEVSGKYTGFPKALGDYIFRQLMVEDGEEEDIYERMYLAVKYCGKSSFHQFSVADQLPCSRIFKIG